MISAKENFMTQDQWYSDPGLRAEWEAILNNPVTKIALSICADKALHPTAIPAGVDLIHFYATLGAKKEGYLDSLANLKALAKRPAAPQTSVAPFDRKAQVEATPKQPQ